MLEDLSFSQGSGGVKGLFKLHPLKVEKAEVEKQAEDKEVPKETPESKEKSLVDKDVDQT